MKIVFLIIDYMPHQLVSINTLIARHDAEVTAFVYTNKETIPDNTKNLTSIPTENLTRKQLLNAVAQIDPRLLVVAGWAIEDYVWVAKQVRSKLKIPTVAYTDSQWRNTLRQNINCIISRWHVRKAFSHLWVAGTYQFEYARRLGFQKENIIYQSLSCDVDFFNQIPLPTPGNYPKNFLFIGRFIELKGIDLLLEAWKRIDDRQGWQLTLIGDGPLKSKFDTPDVICKGFMTHEDIKDEMIDAGCLVLPSLVESWAMVIHEAAAGGLPIICSQACGAAPHFVITGYNGHQVSGTVESIKNAMTAIIDMQERDLVKFAERSRKLSKNITPEKGAANLMSILISN